MVDMSSNFSLYSSPMNLKETCVVDLMNVMYTSQYSSLGGWRCGGGLCSPLVIPRFGATVAGENTLSWLGGVYGNTMYRPEPGMGDSTRIIYIDSTSSNQRLGSFSLNLSEYCFSI